MKKTHLKILAIVILIAIINMMVSCKNGDKSAFSGGRFAFKGYVSAKFRTKLSAEEHAVNITRRTEERFSEELSSGRIKSFTVDNVYNFHGEYEYFLVEFDCIGEIKNPVFVKEFYIGRWEESKYPSLKGINGIWEYNLSESGISGKLYSYENEPEWLVRFNRDGEPDLLVKLDSNGNPKDFSSPYMHLIGYIENDNYFFGLTYYITDYTSNRYGRQWRQSCYKKYGFEDAKKYYGYSLRTSTNFAVEHESEISYLARLYSFNHDFGSYDIDNFGIEVDKSEFNGLTNNRYRVQNIQY